MSEPVAENKSEAKSEAPPVKPVVEDRILVFDNPDKKMNGAPGGLAEWLPCYPFRMLLVGPPGCGKRNTLLNCVMRLDPPPADIKVLHLDPETREYEVLRALVKEDGEFEYYTPDEPPSFAELGGDKRTLVVIDETPTQTMNKQALSELDRLMAYGSTHKNTAVIFSYQNLTSISPSLRRSFNYFVLFPCVDSQVVTLAAHRVGVEPGELFDLLTLCRHSHDSICIDATRPPDSIWRYRLNLLFPIYRAPQ
jgi:hypothetical protein